MISCARKWRKTTTRDNKTRRKE